MWIVFGTAEKMTRVPGGAKVERQCDACGEVTTFYEKHVRRTMRLYFVDVFDYARQRVMACGACGTCYATDELGAPNREDAEGDDAGTLRHGFERVARRAGELIERSADAVEAGIEALLPSRRDEPSEGSEVSHDPPSGDELDPLEARFRELERSEEQRRIRVK
jgi:hypothetical protein